MDSRPLWRWPALCAALHLEEVAGPDVTGISIDSRTLEPGDLFVALSGDPGPRFNAASRSDRDGHAYAPSALARGAAGLLVSHPTHTGAAELQVDDTLDGLWDLARAARARMAGPVVAVTGSSGKTTVKSFLAAALGCPAARGSLNNFWGVPLSMARTPADAHCAIFEIGTNHPGEIAPLAKLARPDVALVLNVLPAHLEFFSDFEALQHEKLSIAEGLEAGGTLVLPDDLDGDFTHRRDLTRLRFGRSGAAEVALEHYDAASRTARIRWPDGDLQARVPGGGVHRALSLTATVACLVALGIDPRSAAGLDESLVPAGRGALHVAAGITVIDDSYNANPVSMRAALDGLAAEETGRRFALLGEMLELGAQSAEFHGGLADACASFDGVLCVGEGMRVLHEALPEEQRLGWYPSAVDFDLAGLAERFAPGDRVLIKGSNRVFWAHDFAEQLLRALRAKKSPG